MSGRVAEATGVPQEGPNVQSKPECVGLVEADPDAAVFQEVQGGDNVVNQLLDGPGGKYTLRWAPRVLLMVCRGTSVAHNTSGGDSRRRATCDVAANVEVW